MFTIDGRQLAGQTGGVQRYISEMLSELDLIAPDGMFEVVVPSSCDLDIKYKSIKVIRYGRFNGLLWEQIDLPLYLRRTKV